MCKVYGREEKSWENLLNHQNRLPFRPSTSLYTKVKPSNIPSHSVTHSEQSQKKRYGKKTPKENLAITPQWCPSHASLSLNKTKLFCETTDDGVKEEFCSSFYFSRLPPRSRRTTVFPRLFPPSTAAIFSLRSVSVACIFTYFYVNKSLKHRTLKYVWFIEVEESMRVSLGVSAAPEQRVIALKCV